MSITMMSSCRGNKNKCKQDFSGSSGGVISERDIYFDTDIGLCYSADLLHAQDSNLTQFWTGKTPKHNMSPLK